MAAAPARKKVSTKVVEPKMFAMKLPPDLMDEVDEIARAERRSRQAQVIVFLEAAVQNWREAHR